MAKETVQNVLDVFDGVFNINGILEALVKARASDKPTFINVRTIIGEGSSVANNAKAHGAAFGPESVANMKRSFGMDPEAHFVIPDTVYDFFREVRTRGERYEANWTSLVESYAKSYPELASEFSLRVEGKMPDDWSKYISPKDTFPTGPTPSRKSAGIVCNPLAQNLKNFMVGTADLSPSVNMIWKDKVDFQNVCLRLS